MLYHAKFLMNIENKFVQYRSIYNYLSLGTMRRAAIRRSLRISRPLSGYEDLDLRKYSHLHITKRTKITADDIRNYKSDASSLASWLDVTIVKRKGRCFDASKSLITAVDADTFPSINVTTLDGNDIAVPRDVDGNVKLIVFSFKHYGFSLVRSWIDPFLERFYLIGSSDVSAVSEESNSMQPAFALAMDGNDSSGSGNIVDVDVQRNGNDKGHSNIMNTSSEKVTTQSRISSSGKKGIKGKVTAFEICMIEYGFLSIAKSVFAQNTISAVHPSQVPYTGLSFGGVKVRIFSFLLKTSKEEC